MKKHVSLLCAAVLATQAFAFSATTSYAAPVRPAPVVGTDHSADLTEVQFRRRGPGFRRGGGGAAGAIVGGLIAGAIIGGAMANAPRAYADNPHTRWCLNRYKSYDPRTDTFQPYNGPRQYCISPYN
jgi:hypothetical protein